MLGSQFFITLGEDLEYLDAEHCVFGEVTTAPTPPSSLLPSSTTPIQVVSSDPAMLKFNSVIADGSHRPYQDVRITHTVVSYTITRTVVS